MKKVLAIYLGRTFFQYLLISEAHHLGEICENFGNVTVKLDKVTKSEYEKYKNNFLTIKTHQ